MSRGLLGFRRFYHYFRGADRIAITDETGTHSYIDLLRDASHLSGTLSRSSSSNVGILVGNESKFVKALWSVWAAGRTAVPLCPSHPSKSHQYFLENSESELILASKDLEDKVRLKGSMTTQHQEGS
ncbi:Uncharacterized protein FKW44_019448 [Caligus rogercresseyi]|uniref:AMP-dependent synthetase/ligase domain-containing protein n=1 Tax=Caligus rogercresseyi TaxID=217165 RepID=A0A7T8JYS6_CALRO|nr:Uncharacterized protein FKW44_019448 [Caligus rogercresseyi]